MATNEQMIKELCKVLAKTNSEKDIKDLLEDLCTNKEVEQMAQRIKTAELLLEGKTYVEVMEEVNVSSATLSRVSRCIQYGKGYNKVLKK